MVGYHYTTLKNYRSIKVGGLLPVPFEKLFIESKAEAGVWLFREHQKSEQLFGVLADTFARHYQDWIMVELEIDFEIEDCIDALNTGDVLKLTHTGSIGPWVYHKDEPIFILKESVSPYRIRLRKKFNLYPQEL